ncbi:unnamed protein product [Owenia fusiformis]|nr:unnamed protein product [Owenia fusiformis]
MALGYNNGSNVTQLVYRPGRVDCPTSPYTKKFNKFPTNGGHGDFNDMLDFLQRQFNYSDRQVVAIMGAHNLGRMSREHSGFIGPWTPCPDVLDNEYYIYLVQNDWVQVNTVVKTTGHRDIHDRFQWSDRSHVPDAFDHNVEKYLNVDIAIYRNISTTSNGKVEVPLNQTSFSRTKAIVEEFAGNNDIWLKEFISAFQAMIQSGCEQKGLKLSPIEKQYPLELPWSDL